MPVVALLVGAGAGLATGLAATDLSLGILGGALVLGLVLGVYGLVSLHLKPIRLRHRSRCSGQRHDWSTSRTAGCRGGPRTGTAQVAVVAPWGLTRAGGR